MEPFIQLKQVEKVYLSGGVETRALDKLSFALEEGTFVVIVGPSGAGKTTLLNLLGGMDTLTGGDLIVGGKSLAGMNKKNLTRYRRDDVGFVFQFYNLMPNLTALENIELAVELCKDAFSPMELLEKVGLSARAGNFPAQLSGGEQQRVSIARAIAKNPKLLLCDEPTGALDYKTGKLVLKLLEKVNVEYKKTVVLITHNSALAPMADKVIHVRSGKVEAVEVNASRVPVDEIEW